MLNQKKISRVLDNEVDKKISELELDLWHYAVVVAKFHDSRVMRLFDLHTPDTGLFGLDIRVSRYLQTYDFKH